MLDIHTIGAGGGSIARLDQANVLHVGPESAGANPGPACFDRGGSLPTITDANVALGRLPCLSTKGFGLQVNKQSAIDAIQPLAKQMGCSVVEAAQGIVSLANAHMAQALRVISIQRGYDPADFSLFPFGGSGTLHMCEVAEELGIHEILIPKNAGVLSAYGMLFAPLGTSTSRSICRSIDDLSLQDVEQQIQQLKQQAINQLQALDIDANMIVCRLELRYVGQSSKLTINWCGDFDQLKNSFSEQYQQQFGFQLPQYPIEVVTIRVWAQQTSQSPQLPMIEPGNDGLAMTTTRIASHNQLIEVYVRHELVREQRIDGPCIVLDNSGTLYVAEDWHGYVDKQGHIHLRFDANYP